MKISLTGLLTMALTAATLFAVTGQGFAETQLLKEADGTVVYDDSGGNGPLVICVPGIGDVRAQYRFLASALKQAGFRVVTMDLRGHGESSVGWPDYSGAAVGSDVVALIQHLGAARVFVVGNSRAGAAAVWAAAQDPAPLTGIVLIDPFVREIPTSWTTRMMLKFGLMWPWGVSLWSHYYASLYPTSPPADLDQYRAALANNLSQPGRMDALRAMMFSPTAPCEARMPEVKARVMVVMGSRDSDFDDPAAEGKLVAERLHGELLMVDGAGHYPHAEMPGTVAPQIIKFLGGTSNGGAAGT